MEEIMPHIKLSREHSAPFALLPGDPARLARIADCLTEVEELAYNREFKSIRGRYKGIWVLAISTGIGGASTAIAVEELWKIGVKYMIRIGSCGALQKGIHSGDLILAKGAVRDDGASSSYVEAMYPAVPDTKLLMSCIAGAEKLGAPYHIGIVRSHDSFYIDKETEVCSYWSKKGVVGSDMETAALFVVGGLRGIKTASILNTVVEYETSLEENINQYTDGESARMNGEKLEILTALEAFFETAENQKGEI